MEATGKYDFDATADDELSFRKGELLKVREHPTYMPDNTHQTLTCLQKALNMKKTFK